MQVRDRIKALKRVKASELIPNPKNWRIHSQSQQDALKGVLTEVGYADALLVRETDDGYMLVDGHLRAETTPDESVPVLVLDINEQEADLVLATLDPLASMATSDDNQLKSLLESISTDNIEVNDLLKLIDNGITPGFEPIGMWEPSLDDMGGIASTDEEIQQKIVIRCSMSEYEALKRDIERVCNGYENITVD